MRISIQGRGHYVKAYVLGRKELNKLLSATEADSIYEDNPYSVVGMLCPSVETVTLGFDPARRRMYRCRIEHNKSQLMIDDLVFDSGDGVDLSSFDPESQLIVKEDPLLALGRGVNLRKSHVLVIEVIHLRDAILSTSVEVSASFRLADLQLIAANLDAPFDLARATYDLGLLDGMDQDIRAVRYGSADHLFELEVLNSSQSSFYLCRRSNDGQWLSEFLG